MAREPIGKKLRFEVFKRDSFTCQYCGAAAPKVELHVDHVVSVRDGGPTCRENLVTACARCNTGKGAEDALCANVERIVFVEHLVGALHREHPRQVRDQDVFPVLLRHLEQIDTDRSREFWRRGLFEAIRIFGSAREYIDEILSCIETHDVIAKVAGR